MHVLAVGMNEFMTSGNWIVGGILNPSSGSSSAPVTNCSTFAKDKCSLRPPGEERTLLDFIYVIIS